jgi:iron(III) transport system substrate-binding protein
MKRTLSSLQAAIVLFVCLAGVHHALAASLEEMVAGAKKEGALNLHAPAALGPKGAQELIASFKEKYGLGIRVNYIPSNSFTADTAKAISQAALGVPSEWDIMLVTDNHHANLWRRGLHLPFEYRSLGVNSQSIEHDKGSVVIAHGIVLPAYNPKILAAKDAPKTWEDLIHPKFGEGKLGVSSATHDFARLAAGPWGEKKTTDFVMGLARQRPFLGRQAELSTRLQLGEILLAAGLPDSQVKRAQERGAPVIFAEKIEPVIVLGYNAGVMKGATHPNAGHLFAAFMVTPEAQTIWEKYRGQSSAFVPGTRLNSFLKGKQALFMAEKDAALVDKLSEDYSKILGFTK